MVICKTPIAAFGPKSGHTSCYIRKQITINFYRDIPTFHRPSVGTQVVTHFGISLLFCCPSLGILMMTFLGISLLFRYPSFGTQIVTHLGIYLFFYYPSIGTQIMTHIGISQHFCPQPLGTLFVTPNLSAIVFANELYGHFWWHIFNVPNKKNSSGLR